MSLNVVGRILVCDLPAVGFDLPTGFVDPWIFKNGFGSFGAGHLGSWRLWSYIAVECVGPVDEVRHAPLQSLCSEFV